MEQNLKQRLVGALVLISLAVIFLPLVFDRQQQNIDPEPYAIPEKPAMTLKSVDIAPLEQQALEELGKVTAVTRQKEKQDEEAASGQEVAAPAADPAVLQPQSQPQAQSQSQSQSQSIPALPTPAQPNPEVVAHIEREKQIDQALQAAPAQPVDLADAWIIQVGAFSSQANADGLRDKLKAAGYPTFVKSTKVASGTLFKVYVGPEIRRPMADRQKQALEQKYQLKALILKYIP